MKINGFRISDSHFKLGSKTHIKDFFYAKRLFQNSVYAHRFAVSLTAYILNYLKTNPEKKPKKLTLIGYGEYSQMLINRMERLLTGTFEEINHNMISDVEEPRLMKKERVHSSVIIIIPIATTFSTSIKIESILKKNAWETGGSCTIIGPFLNVIVVSHGNISDDKYVRKINEYLSGKDLADPDKTLRPYRIYNWQHIDNEQKLVTISTNAPLEGTREEKYFINVSSQWYLMDDCELCMPPNQLLNEVPLLETDRSSVTPDLLLDIPYYFPHQTYTSQNSFIINQEAVTYSHTEFKDYHFLHYIKPNEFFNKYPTAIKEWADGLHNEIKQWKKMATAEVLLISPSYQNNIYFTELINRHVFGDSATIINFDIAGDHLENYRKFFSEAIIAADYIFFVDDIIQSGKTLHEIADFVRTTKGFKNSAATTGLSGIITLISKCDGYAYENILERLDRLEFSKKKQQQFFSFYDVKLNAIRKNDCPLCIERRKYMKLSEYAMLDAIKTYFNTKVKKLTPRPNTEMEELEDDWYRYHPLVDETKKEPWLSEDREQLQKWNTYCSGKFPGKNYLKLLVQHELNRLLSEDREIRAAFMDPTDPMDPLASNKANSDLFSDIKRKMFNSGTIQILDYDLPFASQKALLEVISTMIIKVFTLHPFVSVKSIRQKIFTRILLDLERRMDAIIKRPALRFTDFRHLKFLLRRATLLGSNYLIRKETLDKLRIIYQRYSANKEAIIDKSYLESQNYLNQQIGILTAQQKKLKKKISAKKKELQKLATQKAEAVQTELNYETVEKKNILEISLKEMREQDSELQMKLRYLKQAVQNILYKITTMTEFNYYYVALVKELTLNNEPKILHLEKHILEIGEIDPETEPDFYLLIRLLRLENTSLISQGIQLISKKYLQKQNEGGHPLISFDHPSTKPKVLKVLDEQIELAFKDYHLDSFWKFLNVDDLSEWKKTDSYYIYRLLLYLVTALENEEKSPSDASLEQKSKTILKNLYRLVCYRGFLEDQLAFDSAGGKKKFIFQKDMTGEGIFLSLRFRGARSAVIKPEEMIVAQAFQQTQGYQEPLLMRTQIDSSAFSYFFINGVTNVANPLFDDGKLDKFLNVPLTIAEFSRIENNGYAWKCLQGGLKPLHYANLDDFRNLQIKGQSNMFRYDFTENLFIAEDTANMLFCRIPAGGDTAIAHAVIGIYSDLGPFDVTRLRLLLLVRGYMKDFIGSHYNNDSLAAFVDERSKLLEAERLKHGYPVYLSCFSELAKKSEYERCNRDDLIHLYYYMLSSGPVLPNLLNAYEEAAKSGNLFGSSVLKALNQTYKSKEYTAADILDRVTHLKELIYRSDIYETDEVDTDKDLVYFSSGNDLDWKFSFYEGLLTIIIAEVLINGKKAQKTLDDGYKLSVTLTTEDDRAYLIISNKIKTTGNLKTLQRLKKNNSRYDTHGIGLIKRITNIFFREFVQIDILQDEKLGCLSFQTKIPLKNIVI